MLLSPTLPPLGRPDVARLVPPRLDVAIAVLFVVLTLAEAATSPGVGSPLLHVIVAGAAMGALAWRRRFPLVVASLVIGANILINPEGDFSTLLSLVLVSFTIGYETKPPSTQAGLLIVVVPFMVAMVREGLEPSDVAAALVFLVGPWAVGRVARERSARTDEAEARARQLQEEQQAQAAQAVEQERTRIARELHDIVSHSISVVAIQTQAVRRRLRPEQTAEAADLAAVESTAREALAEMRRLFGVLRADGEAASLSPQPGLAELDRLLATVRSSGLEVELVVEGEPHDLPPGVDLAAFPIVQESLTNTIRHAGATRARVLLSHGATTLDLVVDDDGGGPGEPRPGGHGLVGVRERVALYGGTADLATGPLGGARLSASLPVREQA